jgi:2'-5' RNA ligase
MRCFVAAIPPPEAVDHLEEFLAVRREHAAYRWTPEEQWHLTLAFSDALPERSLDDAVERLTRAARKRHPMGLRIAGGGAFPHADRARVLYAAVATDDAVELDRLATGSRAALAKAGARVDGQRFRAHLTLARLSHPDNVTGWVRLLDAYQGPEWVLDEVALVASHLGEGPRRRPRHEVLETFALGASSR